MKTLPVLTALALLGFAAGCNQKSENQGSSADTSYHSTGQDRQPANSSGTVDLGSSTNKADNTSRNTRDRSDATLTPTDQGGSDADRNTTRQIRRAIMQDDKLSSNAKNVKIITVNGKVTLRGPVNSDQEKAAIMDAAQKVASPGAVDNQLEVKTTAQ